MNSTKDASFLKRWTIQRPIWMYMLVSGMSLFLLTLQIKVSSCSTDFVSTSQENLEIAASNKGLEIFKDSYKEIIASQEHNFKYSDSQGSIQKHPENITLSRREEVNGQTDQTQWPPWETLKEEDIKTEKDRIYFQKYWFLPPRNKDCDKMKGPGLDYTLVTALIDLKRENWPHFKRQFVKYLFYAVKMLNLNAPMVIFVEEVAIDFVEYHRQGKEHITKIIPVSIRDLEYYKQYDRIEEVMASEEFKKGHSMLHHPEGFSTDYNILMNSKHSMLYLATTEDYHKTGYFYWMDVGYGHGEDIFPKSCLWSPNSIMNSINQITYIELNPLTLLRSVNDLYKQFLPPFLNGAFFGGPKISVKRYYFLHRETLEEFLSESQIDDDQTMAVACYFKRPLLFNIVHGWWYDAFSLFK